MGGAGDTTGAFVVAGGLRRAEKVLKCGHLSWSVLVKQVVGTQICMNAKDNALRLIAAF